VTKRWLHTLSREFPTLAFHASITNPFGKGSLLSLLRQLARLRTDKQYISVGLVGYPNVGKSSVINTLRSKKVGAGSWWGRAGQGWRPTGAPTQEAQPEQGRAGWGWLCGRCLCTGVWLCVAYRTSSKGSCTP
jgi:ribosome biogenesis GTPase A